MVSVCGAGERLYATKHKGRVTYALSKSARAFEEAEREVAWSPP